MQEVISSFADILALLYHEGRNVRHLSRNKTMNVDPRFLSLRDGLATNRYQAWEQIQPLRGKAVLSPSARLARIHRRRASGQCPEAARGCSCESGIMVLKQQTDPRTRSTQ